MAYIGGGGLGNLEPREENAVYLWSATVISGLFALVPFFMLFETLEGAENLFISMLALVFGLLVFLWNVKQLALFMCGTKSEGPALAQPSRETKPTLLPLLSNRLVAESWNKQAAYHKVEQATQNAMQLAKGSVSNRSIFNSYAGHSMYNFVAESENAPVQQVGGFFWTWRKIQSGKMFFEEGIWFSSRLVAANVLQIAIVVFLLILGIRLTDYYANDQYDDFPAIDGAVTSFFDKVRGGNIAMELTSAINRQFTAFVANDAMLGNTCPGDSDPSPHCNDVVELFDCILNNGTDPLCTLVDYNRTTPPEVWNFNTQNQLLSLSGLNLERIVSLSASALETYLDESISSLYPDERYMVTIPLAVATITAVLTATSIWLQAISATATTIMKFRCGEFPSLHSASFAQLKQNTKPHFFLGQMFWGALVSSLLLALIFGGFAFFMVWQVNCYGFNVVMILVIVPSMQCFLV